MKRVCRLMSAGLVMLGVMAATAPTSNAAIGYGNLCPSLGTALCTAGTAVPNEGVAVDDSSGPSAGDVWVASGIEGVNEAKLVKFDASGNLLLEVTDENIPGSAQPVFSQRAIQQDAVDPADGDVYLASTRPGVVTKFDSSGVFQLQFTGSETPQGSFAPYGVAVGAGGDIYVSDSEHRMIDRFTSAGKYIEQFPAPGVFANTLAVGPEGNLYVGSAGQVSEYSPTGAPVNCPGASNVLPVEGTRGAVAIDPSDGHIFTGASNLSESYFVAEYSSLCASVPSARLGPHEFGPGGPGLGLAVNGLTHVVYSSNFQQEFALVFGRVVLPDVVTNAPVTGVTRASATVSGTVNPDETSVTGCEVEYGVTTAYGESAPCAQSLPLEGNSALPVSTEIKFSLPPASLVHYRFKAANANGSNFGEDHTFFTESLPPPVVGGLPASGVTQFAATLDGTLQTGEGLANYRFEYGSTTGYGSVAPIPDGYTPITNETVHVSQPIQGLQAGTTYHYRLVVSSPGATEVKGPDEMFTTLPIPAPGVETGGASGVGVGSATVVGAVDPHGWDTTYLFQYGTSTAYGSSWPTVQVDMGALEGLQPVVVKIPNLLPSTTYHYRLVASNGGGTSYGADGTFTTGEYPAQVIQEPVVLQTLLVPSGGKAAKPSSKHGKKAKKGKKGKKRKKRTKSKRKVRGKKKH